MPTTMAGLVAFAEYVAAYYDRIATGKAVFDPQPQSPLDPDLPM